MLKFIRLKSDVLIAIWIVWLRCPNAWLYANSWYTCTYHFLLLLPERLIVCYPWYTCTYHFLLLLPERLIVCNPWYKCTYHFLLLKKNGHVHVVQSTIVRFLMNIYIKVVTNCKINWQGFDLAIIAIEMMMVSKYRSSVIFRMSWNAVNIVKTFIS